MDGDPASQFVSTWKSTEDFYRDDERRRYNGPGEGPADDELVTFKTRSSHYPGTSWQVIHNRETGEVYAVASDPGPHPNVLVLGWAANFAEIQSRLGTDPLTWPSEYPDGVEQIVAALRR